MSFYQVQRFESLKSSASLKVIFPQQEKTDIQKSTPATKQGQERKLWLELLRQNKVLRDSMTSGFTQLVFIQPEDQNKNVLQK